MTKETESVPLEHIVDSVDSSFKIYKKPELKSFEPPKDTDILKRLKDGTQNQAKGFEIERIKTADGLEMLKIIEGNEIKNFTIEMVEGPEDPDLRSVYSLMEQTFKPEDMQTFESVQDSTIGKNYGVESERNTKFFIIKEGNEVISLFSCTTAELMDNNGQTTGEHVVLLGYAATKENMRKYGLAREAYIKALEFFLRDNKSKNGKLIGSAGECTWTSEQFWNRVGLNRIYTKGDDFSFKELEYMHPPLDYDTISGEKSPEADEGPEHLMVHMFNPADEKGPKFAERLGSIVDAFNRWSSYIPKDAFKGTPEAYAKHVESIKAYEDTFNAQLSGDKELTLMPRAARKAFLKGGIEIKTFLTDPRELEETVVRRQINSDTL